MVFMVLNVDNWQSLNTVCVVGLNNSVINFLALIILSCGCKRMFLFLGDKNLQPLGMKVRHACDIHVSMLPPHRIKGKIGELRWEVHENSEFFILLVNFSISLKRC